MFKDKRFFEIPVTNNKMVVLRKIADGDRKYFDLRWYNRFSQDHEMHRTGKGFFVDEIVMKRDILPAIGFMLGLQVYRGSQRLKPLIDKGFDNF